MLRLHFTSTDLARVRLRPPPPMTEVVHGFELLRQRTDAVVFDDWRRRTRRRLDSSVRPLADLVPPRGWWPAFLNPHHAEGGMDAALEAIHSTPRSSLRSALTNIAKDRPLPQWTLRLAEGDREALTRLTNAVRAFHDAGIAPYQHGLRARRDAELAMRGHILAEGGLDRLLQTLHPRIRWQSPTLSVPWPKDRDFDLAGRGLTLMPSVFSRAEPEPYLDSDPPVLVYPVPRDPVDLKTIWQPAGTPGTPGALAALLGRTRAATLDVIAAGCTTSELARRLAISPASASEHASILRGAGLVVSQRHRNTTRHTLTPLGRALLDR